MLRLCSSATQIYAYLLTDIPPFFSLADHESRHLDTRHSVFIRHTTSPKAESRVSATFKVTLPNNIISTSPAIRILQNLYFHPHQTTTVMYPEEKATMHSEKSAMDIDSESLVPNTKLSTSSTACTFEPTRTLTISTKGQPWFRLPLPARELVTEILRGPNNPAYISTRLTRSSGDCNLVAHPSCAVVAKTSYVFGPGRSRSPLITFFGESDEDTTETRVESMGRICGRNAMFTHAGVRWVWLYATDARPRISDGETMKTNLLVLYRAGQKVAELVRNDETRTEGTSKSYAGNGGVLVLGDVDEVVVVATACVMLKREVDRRRLVQMMIMGGGGGGP